jgi:hypothetical protein
MVLSLLVAVPLVLVIGFTWTPTVLSYEIHPAELVIRAHAGVLWHDRSIELDRIEDVRAVRLSGGTRTMGTGMPGFCAGRFDYPSIGTVWQATSCVSRAVMLRVRGEERPVILSPAARTEFIGALHSRTPGTFPPVPAGRTPGWWGLLLGVFALLPVPLLLVFFVAPGRLRYRVDGRTLEIRTLARRIPFSLEGARARRYRPARAWRMMGVGLPGYATGWFRFDGANTRVYASSREGVLIENGRRLFVSPADTDGFLAALTAAGVTVER